MRNQTFVGTGVALITPFLNDGSLDHPALARLVEYQVENGIDFIVALGTTAETPTLSEHEKMEVLLAIKKAVNGRVPLIAGAGGNNTPAVVSWIKQVEEVGVDGILTVAPYYNKPSQKGMIAHFSYIAERTQLPIILYNVPGRTSSNIAAETTLALANTYEHIVAIKEASGDLSQMMAIQAGCPEDFYILSGEDGLTLPMMSVGCKGVISVIAQAYPKEYKAMVSAAAAGDYHRAKSEHYNLLEITNSIYLEGNPTGIKSLLSHLGICGNVLRLPLISSSEELDKTIKENMLKGE